MVESRQTQKRNGNSKKKLQRNDVHKMHSKIWQSGGQVGNQTQLRKESVSLRPSSRNFQRRGIMTKMLKNCKTETKTGDSGKAIA